MTFPLVRKRRLRRNENLRRLVRETRLSADDFILPLFVCPGRGVKNAISPTCPGEVLPLALHRSFGIHVFF